MDSFDSFENWVIKKSSTYLSDVQNLGFEQGTTVSGVKWISVTFASNTFIGVIIFDHLEGFVFDVMRQGKGDDFSKDQVLATSIHKFRLEEASDLMETFSSYFDRA
jgi:hypothetical protein